MYWIFFILVRKRTIFDFSNTMVISTDVNLDMINCHFLRMLHGDSQN